MRIVFSIIALFIVSANASAQDVGYDIDSDELRKEFAADTAWVEQYYRDDLDRNVTRSGMVEAGGRYEENYDKLLNKYYLILLGTLEPKSQEVLKNTQRNWMQLRDSEKLLIRALHSKGYNDTREDTEWSLVEMDVRSEITRRRVFEIFDYLLFPNLN